MEQANTLLNNWIKLEGRKAAWLADRLGVSRDAVYQWRQGNRLPIMPYRREIERITEGAVPADAWK